MPIFNFIELCVDYTFAILPRKKPSKLLRYDTCVIAHRGAHNKKQRIIENTHLAFVKALSLGCWGIEFDVHATADLVLVVNHDKTLHRLWKKPFAIKDLTFQELKKIAPDIPSLAEVIERYGKQMHLFIELKAPFTAEVALKQELSTLTPCIDYHLISLDESTLAALMLFSREVMLLVSSHNNITRFYEHSLQKHYGGVLGHYLLLNDSKIRRLKLANKVVGVGLVNSKYSLYRELTRGLSWIFSDNAELLTALLQELHKDE